MIENKKLIRVKVKTGQKKEKVTRKSDQLILKLKEEAKRGEANRRIFKILSLIFPEKRIELVKGSKSKNKIFKIYDKKN